MIAGFLTSPSSFIRPWHLGQARTSTANVRARGLTTAIVNKLLHPPTVHLKEAASNGHATEHVGFIRKLLSL